MAWQIYAIWAAAFIIQKLMTPKPKEEKEKRAKFGDAGAPRAEEGTPIPLFWGRVKISGASVVWYGNFGKTGQYYAAYDVGAAYHVSLHMSLGIPGNGIGFTREFQGCQLLKFWIGDEVAWQGEMDTGQSVTIRKPFFFGSRGEGGGVVGEMYFFGGTDDQDLNVGTIAAEFTEAGMDAGLLPSYVGQAMVVFANRPGHTHTGWMIGESLSLDAYSFEVQSDTVSDIDVSSGGSVFQVAGGDANPAAVLVDIITSQWGKVGQPVSRVNQPSFKDAADILRVERHGFSAILYSPNNARDLIDQIQEETNGILFMDPSTNEYKFKLIRNDYNVALLPSLTEDDIEDMEYSVSGWTDTFNEVRINFQDRTSDYQTRTMVAQDSANLEMMDNKLRSVTLEFIGTKTKLQAARLATRELYFRSVPLAKARIRVNRKAFPLLPGDVFKLSYQEYDLVDVVFRVQRYDLGQPGDEAITLDIIQDRFGVDAAIYEPETEWPMPAEVPLPLRTRLLWETPRWVAQQAVNRGQIPNVESRRGLYLAHPEQARSSTFATWLTMNHVQFFTDVSTASYPGAGVLFTAYSRTLDPYDTTTGVVFDRWDSRLVLQAATATEIREQGKNLFIMGEELMAYETFTDLGGGQFRLNNVWRGLLDTTPVAHVVGEPLFFVSDAAATNLRQFLGQTGVLSGETANAKFLPRLGPAVLDDELLSEFDSRVFSRRVERPYPPADVLINGVKTLALLEEGPTLTWKKREKTALNIRRGDEASDTLVGTVHHTVVAQATPTHQSNGGQVSFAFADVVTSTVNLAPAGHGPMKVGARSFDTVSSLNNREDSLLDIDAKVWRNLLRNSRFDDGLNGWVTEAGTPAVGSATPLGGSGFYLTGALTLATVVVSQTVDLTGWTPEFMQARLEFYDRMLVSDPDDTVRVDLEALSALNVVLGTQTYGPTTPSTSVWNKRTLAFTALPAGTTKVKVKITLVGTGSLDDTSLPSGAVTELRLQVGQLSAALLSNAGFESGTTSSWTVATGSWFIGGSAYEGNNAVYAGSVSSATLTQTVAIPAGFTVGTTAVLRGSRMSDLISTSDTAELILEALDGGGTMMAIAQTPPVAPPFNVWRRDTVYLEIPDNAVSLRVTLRGIRFDGTALNVAFDDIELQVHKYLQPQYRTTLDYSRVPVQPLYANREQWYLGQGRDGVPMPDYAFFAGRVDNGKAVGELNIEVPMESTYDVTSELVAPLGDGRYSAPAYVLKRDTAGTAALQAGNDDTWMNFRVNQSFTVAIVFRVLEENFAVACGLVGRRGTTGWSLSLSSAGAVAASLVSAAATKSATVSGNRTRGGLHLAAIIYDAVADTLTAVCDGVSTTVSTTAGTALGEIECLEDTARFQVGRASISEACLPGQVAAVWAWRSALSAADMAALYRYGTDPTGLTGTYTRTGTIAVPVPPDADGVRLACYEDGQIAMAYSDQLGSDELMGLALPRARTNLLVSQDFRNVTHWVPDGGVSLIHDLRDASRIPRGVTWSGTNSLTNSLKAVLIPVGVSTTVRVVWFARITHTGSDTCRLTLCNASDVVKGTHDYTVTNQWQRFEHTFTTWDNSSATCRLRFFASADGTSGIIELSAPIFVSQDTDAYPPFLPVGGLSAAVGAAGVFYDPPAQSVIINHEGMVDIAGVLSTDTPGTRTLAEVTNSSNSNDRRTLGCDSSHQATFAHADSVGTTVTNTGAALTWSNGFGMSGHWSRSKLLDNATGSDDYTMGVFNGTKVFGGRTAIWTPSTTAAARIRLGGTSGIDGVVLSCHVVSREIVRGSL